MFSFNFFSKVGLCLTLALVAQSGFSNTSSNGNCGIASSKASSSSGSSLPSKRMSCQVALVNQWSGGYQIDVRVANIGTSATDKWAVTLDIPGSDNLASVWNATKLSQNLNSHTYGNLAWNGVIAPSVSTSFGATLTRTSTTTGLPTCRIDNLNVNHPPTLNMATTIIRDTVHLFSYGGDVDFDKLTYTVNWGDGQSINYRDAWHTYAAPGTYTITETVSDGKAVTTGTRAVTVTAAGANRAPSALFSYYASGLHIFTNGSGSADKDANPLDYTWDFGIPLTVYPNQATADAYVSAGTNLVTLTVFDGELGNTVQIAVPVSICSASDSAPEPDFTSSINNLRLDLDASISRGADKLTWDFGDGTSATGMYVSHSYAAAGSYTVKLTATSGVRVASKSVIVEVKSASLNLPPLALFSCVESLAIGDNFSTGVATYTYTTRCDATASTDPEGHSLSYRMAWGDGLVTTSANGLFYHNYATGGAYNLILEVSDSTNTSTKNLAWVASTSYSTNTAPVSCFDVSGTSSASVNASCSTDANGDSLTYSWDFGDGTSATGAIASHNYSASGTYTIKLTVSDGNTSTSLTKSFTYTASAKKTHCEFKILNQWSTGFEGALLVYNDSTEPVSDWQAVLTFPAFEGIQNSFNGKQTGTNPYTFTSMGWNNTIAPGKWAQVGMLVWKTDNTKPNTPATVSGPSCQ